MSTHRHTLALRAMRFSAFYLLLSAPWIYLGDQLLLQLTRDPDVLTLYQTYKGWFFVACSALIMFLLVWWALHSTEKISRSVVAEKEKYLHLFESNPQPMMVVDRETLKFLDVNKAAVNHYGYSHDEFLTMAIKDIRPAEDAARAEEFVARVDDGLDRMGYWRHLKKDGTEITVEIITHTTIYNGRPANLVHAHDVTEKLKAVDALRKSEERYRLLAENTVNVIWSMTPDLVFTYVSRRVYDMTGIPADEWIGSHLTRYLDDREFERVKEVIAAELANGPDSPGVVFETQILDREHKPVPVEVHWRFVYDDDNQPVSMQGITIDLTERKQFMVERERLLLAIEQAGEMVIITDINGVIEYVNPAFERTTGYQRAEVIGRNCSILKSGVQDDAFYQNLWQTINSGRVFHATMVNKRKDGTLFTEDATISPVRDPSGRVINFVAVKHDITEQLRQEAHYRQAQKMEAIGRLAGGVAHDYNNMLSVILGNAQLATYEVTRNHPVYELLEEIITATQRSTAMTRQLLAFARQQPISPQNIDINQSVEELIGMLRKLIGENIALVWKPGARGCRIKIDPAQVDQILTNLCVNARDAIAGIGRIIIETKEVVLAEDDCADRPGLAPGKFIILTVSDNGAGMDKDTLTNVFEPFYTTKSADKGTGLGLATVYGIVKQNNGFINVYSEPGEGTTIKVYLPQSSVTAETTSPVRQHDRLQGKGETILLVDDEPALVAFGRKVLEKYGYKVLSAESPGEALDLMREYRQGIDLLITDVIMPQMHGRDLAEQLQQAVPELKTLYMSGYTDSVIAERGIIDEHVNFIQKPIAVDELVTRVRSILDA